MKEVAVADRCSPVDAKKLLNLISCDGGFAFSSEFELVMFHMEKKYVLKELR